jgi:hypothetical protein
MNNLSFGGHLQFIHFVAVSAERNMEFGCHRQPVHAGTPGTGLFRYLQAVCLRRAREVSSDHMGSPIAGRHFNGWSGEF